MAPVEAGTCFRLPLALLGARGHQEQKEISSCFTATHALPVPVVHVMTEGLGETTRKEAFDLRELPSSQSGVKMERSRNRQAPQQM